MISAELVTNRLSAYQQRALELGLRQTPQRLVVYRILAGTDEHPDVETIHARVKNELPSISLDTVYRILGRFEAFGLVSRVGVLAERARFDANVQPHPHFFCSRCEAVMDIVDAQFTLPTLPAKVAALGRVHAIQLQVRGVCAACLKQE